jgi:3-hexulose-6-phosphate synthase/6-phospho-3-hexuloisomerase
LFLKYIFVIFYSFIIKKRKEEIRGKKKMKLKSSILQIALDFLNLKRAMKVAEEAVKGGVDWIEVGTPLIKSEGLSAVRKIKKKFPGKKILADLKTIDTGRYEVEAAAKAGADVVIILALADNSTIKEAVEAGKNYGCEIMVDLLNVPNLEKRAKEIENLGVDYICVHLGIDQQMLGLNPLEELKKLSGKIKVPLAIAGGINSENVAKAIKVGASITIVGGAITKAENAILATKKIKKAMRLQKEIKTELYKKYLEPEKIFKIVSSANISDAMHRVSNLKGIKLLSGGGEKFFGKAITVRTHPGDWAKPLEALDIAKKGDVIVIDSGGVEPAVWGELASWSAKKKKVSGVVVWGAIRDLEEIKKIKFPLAAKIICSHAGEPRGFGEINVPIRIFNVLIKPGDYVIADEDGVIVVPKENSVEIANRALDVYERENRIREEIKRGSTLSKVMELKKWEKVS